jgi:hypothetical protein
MPAVTETLGRVRAAGAWLVAALLLAFGSAGIVAATTRVPGTPARAELTWAADAAARAQLDELRVDLQHLADNVADLGTVARGAIAALSDHDATLLQASITDGTVRAVNIEGDAAVLRAKLAALTEFGPGAATRLSRSLIDAHAAIVTASNATDGLESTWATLAQGALAADDLTSLLLRHDETVGAAALLGRDNDWAGALLKLDEAGAIFAEATAQRTILARTAEVTTLDEWLRRNERYDAALRTLYEALIASDGRVNDEVRDAFSEETAARADLPPDTRGLVLIIAEAGRGGLNAAVVDIETLRGRLFEAIEASTEASPEPSPG